MYAFYGVLGLMVMTWVTAVWAYFPPEEREHSWATV